MGEVVSADEALVRQVEARYDRAWSDGNIDGLLACLTDDAVLVNPRGEVAVGSLEIRAALGTFLSGEALGSVHESTIRRVAFVGDGVAVVDGDAVIRTPESAEPLVEHFFTDILVRTDTGWAIAHVRAYTHEPGPP